MEIRRAIEADIAELGRLLLQVNEVHHTGRPDLFKHNGRKYSDDELRTLLSDPEAPVLVAMEGSRMLGYSFCQLKRHANSGSLTDITTLYLDDLCVDEACRGQHVGRALYDATLALARELRCHNLTLNVWCCNPSAMAFYQHMGLVPQKIGMEQVLE